MENNTNCTNKKSLYPWALVGLLWFVALLNYMDRQMLSTMQEAMKIDIVELQSAESFGFLMAIFLYIYGFMSPVSGIIADRLSRKWIVVGSLFVWSAVTLLMGYSEDFEQLVVLRALMGVSEALYIPAGLSLIADWHEGKSRSLAVGIHMTGLYAGQAIGGFGATVAAALTWQETFHWFGIVGMFYAIILIFFLKEKRVSRKAEDSAEPTAVLKKENIFKGLSVVLSNWVFWVILFYFAAPSLPGWATKNWLPTLFSENLSMDMSQAGPLSTITIAISSFIGVIIGGVMSDRWVKKNLKGRIYTSAIGLGMTIPSLLLLGYGSSVFSVVGAGVLFGIGFGMFDANNMPILCQFVSSKYRATAYGLMNMTGVFAGAGVTQLLGRFKGEGVGELGYGFAMLSVVVAAALALQLFTLNPKTDNME